MGMSPSSRTSGRWSSGSATPGAPASRAARCAASSSRRPGLTCTHRRTGPAPDPTRRSGASPGVGRVRWRGHPVYGLVEWAHTSEADGFFEFSSVLAEGAWSTGPHRLYYRFERTERAEDERVSRFRTLRPHQENSILGDDPLDDPHRGLVRRPARPEPAWRSPRWSRSPTGGSPRSGAGSSTWSRPMGRTISGAGPWGSASMYGGRPPSDGSLRCGGGGCGAAPASR